jgi:hypothetical protein
MKKTLVMVYSIAAIQAIKGNLDSLQSLISNGWIIVTCVCSGSGDHHDTLIYTLTKEIWE